MKFLVLTSIHNRMTNLGVLFLYVTHWEELDQCHPITSHFKKMEKQEEDMHMWLVFLPLFDLNLLGSPKLPSISEVSFPSTMVSFV